jgi:hypothetical protein
MGILPEGEKARASVQRIGDFLAEFREGAPNRCIPVWHCRRVPATHPCYGPIHVSAGQCPRWEHSWIFLLFPVVQFWNSKRRKVTHNTWFVDNFGLAPPLLQLMFEELYAEVLKTNAQFFAKPFSSH